MQSVKIYEGKYEVFEDGSVVSFARRSPKVLVGKITNCGYIMLILTVDNKKLYKDAHRIVAEAFLKRIDGKNQVNHKNGVKTDNRLENLEWVSAKENHIHARDTGLYKYAKINMKQAKQIRILYNTGDFSHRELGERFNLKKTQVGYIVNNLRWTE